MAIKISLRKRVWTWRATSSYCLRCTRCTWSPRVHHAVLSNRLMRVNASMSAYATVKLNTTSHNISTVRETAQAADTTVSRISRVRRNRRTLLTREIAFQRLHRKRANGVLETLKCCLWGRLHAHRNDTLGTC